jgi:hypothetical protein
LASRKEYLDRFKKIRAKRIRKRAGKDLIFDEDAMIGHLANNAVPTMMQHCVIQVRKKMDGNEMEKYISSYNICASVFQKYGYMKKDSLVMTGKGTKNNNRHKTEKDAAKKGAKFRALTNRLWRKSIDRFKQDEVDRTPDEPPLKHMRQTKADRFRKIRQRRG